MCALLLHSSRLINARKAWLTYNSGKPICGQFSEHCSKLSALKKDRAFWSTKFPFYQYQRELGLDVQVNEYTKFTGYCLAAVETIVWDLKVLKYIRGSKFLDRVIISSFHWFQNIEVRGWEVQMGASLSLAFTQRRNHLSDFCFFPSTFWLLCQWKGI